MKDYIVYSLSANKKLAKRVSDVLKCQLGRTSITHFADGEMLVKTASDVKDKDVVVIQSTDKRAHTRLFELLLFIDSVKRSGANSVTLIMPYFGYSRQERVSWTNEPVSCEVVARMINTTNVDKLLTFDLHHPIIEEFFEVPIFNLLSTSLFGEYYLSYFKKQKISLKDVVVVSPDHGSNGRANELVDLLPGSKKVILDKVRPQVNRAEHLEVEEELVKDKFCIIIDDIIDTGNTIASATSLLLKHNAKSVYIAATHAVFSQNCIDKLLNAGVSDIVVTNTIEKRLSNRIKVLDILPIVIEELRKDNA